MGAKVWMYWLSETSRGADPGIHPVAECWFGQCPEDMLSGCQSQLGGLSPFFLIWIHPEEVTRTNFCEVVMIR